MEPSPYTPGATTVWNNSWRQIYDQFGTAILAYARRRGLNDHSAHDVLQEVMVAVIRCQLQAESAYDPTAGAFQAWLWGIIRNRVRSIRRADGRQDIRSPLAPSDAAGDLEPALPELSQPPADLADTEEEHWRRALIAAALHKVQARATAKNFAIYAALLGERATVKELSATYRKKPNAIYAIKHRYDAIFLVEARAIRTAWENMHPT